MRNLDYLNKKRLPYPGTNDIGNEFNGIFKIQFEGTHYIAIASNGAGWEHVSISHHNKTPNWDTMCKFKDMFFDEEEVVIQFHPKKSEYVNNHPHCLHLWRPLNHEIITPPSILVGLK